MKNNDFDKMHLKMNVFPEGFPASFLAKSAGQLIELIC